MIWKKKEPIKLPSEKKNLRKDVFVAGGLTLLVAIIAIAGLTLRKSHNLNSQRSSQEKDAHAGNRVQTTRVEKAPPYRDITLIGEARPFFDVVIYARAAGYLKKINVDKGDPVVEGQILAVIESPETDKAYISAMADAYNKKRIADRSKVLLRRKLISQQEADAAFANSDMAAATFETEKVLKSYEEVRAPFTGTIANRYVDPGALLQNATSGESSNGALFEIAKNDVLRVYTYPDQPDAALVQRDTPVEILLAEKPQLRIQALVTRTSELLDYKTRKLLTEIDISNDPQRIVAGSFVQVHARLKEEERLQVPVEALAVRGGKSEIPVVRADQTIHYQEVGLGKNDGKSIQIINGLKEGDVIALNLGNSVNEGQKVQGKMIELAGTASLPEQGAVPQIGSAQDPNNQQKK